MTSLVRTEQGERSFRRMGLLWLAIVAGVVLIGSVGYVAMLGWSIGDAMYMTVITLTTVGFKEVRELDDIGRIWTSIMAVSGVAIIFGTVGLVAESFVAETVSGRREKRRMADAANKLSEHFILCGYGRMGTTVARELDHAGVKFVIIDINQESVDQAARDGWLVVAGDATHDAVLQSAGIDRARGLITTTDSDANNVYVTLSARALNKDLFIVARGIHPLAISHSPREYETNPAPDRTLLAGDHLIISGTAETIGGLRAGR